MDIKVNGIKVETNSDNASLTVYKQGIITISASEIELSPEPEKYSHQS